MPSKNEELKADLLAEAEKVISQMLGDRAKKEYLTITDIEGLARSVGQAMMQQVSQRLAGEESQPEEWKECPTCGQRMRTKGKKGRDVILDTGEVRIERDYYYCEHCRKGIFPPG
jgi:uncharacterized protein with PIN domain